MKPTLKSRVQSVLQEAKPGHEDEDEQLQQDRKNIEEGEECHKGRKVPALCGWEEDERGAKSLKGVTIQLQDVRPRRIRGNR